MSPLQIIFDMIEGKRRGRSLLRALSYLYRGGVALRNWGYDHEWFKSFKAPLPIISVGNIVAGGTGKTPFVKFLVEQLQGVGPVAILSRGYRSLAEKSGQTLCVNAKTVVVECGDEPYWLSQQLPQAQVWVGKNRCKSAHQAHAAGARIAILDDGMQHRQLKRDFEIVLMNGDDLLGKGFFLPRGFLRDSPRRLQEADLIGVVGEAPQAEVEKELRRWSDASIVFFQTKTEVSLQGKRVGVFCAIAAPERFLKTVRAAGGKIITTYFKPDHHPFFPHEVEHFAKESGAEMLVCTEKDFVKLPSNLPCRAPIIPLPCHLEITGNLPLWEAMLSKIKTRISP